MPYRPKYCCECGDQIERTDWRLWHSRRFCKVCENDYFFQDWMPQITGIGAVLVVFVSSFYFQKPEKPMSVSPNQLVSSMSNGRISANQNAAQFSNAAAVQTIAQSNNTVPPTKVPVTALADKKLTRDAVPPVETAEKVYFCGAATKKGTPCSRRVRGGGRCWQHTGQTALTAQEKLLIN